MIRRVRLENWRAYRHLDLPVGPGVTFLVAANGVGKSSLLEAVRWALAPGPTSEDSSAIRHGHDEAAATVTLSSDQGELEVRRVMRLRGTRATSSLEAKLDGREIRETEFRQLLTDTWYANLTFVSKTAFLTGDPNSLKEEPDLRAHLCQVYSLDQLQRALTEIRAALGEANRGVKIARAEFTATEGQLNVARQERAELEERMKAARSEVSAVRERAANAQRAADQAAAVQRMQAATAAWDRQFVALHQDIERMTDVRGDKTSMSTALHQAKLLLRQEVDATRAEQAKLSARLESIEEMLARLQAAGGQCPVCLRELDGQSRQRAEHLHREGLTGVQERLRVVNPQPLLERLNQIESFELRVATIGERPAAEMTADHEATNTDVVAARAALEHAVGALRELEIAAQSSEQRIGRIMADLAQAEQLKRRYRQVALLEAADKALNSTISSVLGEQLAPLVREVNRRWQAVFPDRPNLALLPDGTMTRDVGGSPLAITAFSAGEKMVAKLMMRLTTLLVTTKVPFCWVDEPLEHLDPRNRHLVGSMLTHLGADPGLEQIFVTTYEEPLARRLAELQPSRVRVEYLRTEHVN